MSILDHVRRPGIRRALAVALLAGFLPLTSSGCFGTFQLTRKVYQFNQDATPEKWGRWFVFLVLVVVPVYGIATMADALFFNSVEFWTGSNPVTANAREVHGPNGLVARTRVLPGDVLEVEVLAPGGERHVARFEKLPQGIVARDVYGTELARVSEAEAALGLGR